MKKKRSTKLRKVRQITQGALAQQQILEAVDELFYREGVRAVSVDAVVKLAGLNKMAVYRQFDSKDDLLLHYLARSDETFWGYFEASVSAQPANPRAQLVQFFLDLEKRAAQPGFRGCPFVNIAAELADPGHPARRMVAESKARLLARLLNISTAAGVSDPQGLANGLALLIEGAYAASQTYGLGHPLIRSMSAVAESMVKSAADPQTGQR
jgi:AcrR family transcriptional regulator